MEAGWRSYLAIFLCVGAREQRMEDNDCLVQIPHKHPLEDKNTRRWEMLFQKCCVDLFSPCLHSCSAAQWHVWSCSLSASPLLYSETSVSREDEHQRECRISIEIWVEYSVSTVSALSVGVLRSLTSRSLSGGGEGLFLRPLPRDLDPPLRQARSSSSLMGVEGLCTVSKSPESVFKQRQG